MVSQPYSVIRRYYSQDEMMVTTRFPPPGGGDMARMVYLFDPSTIL
jgi:hypothetical protein